MFISEAFAAAGTAGAESGSLAVTLTQLGLILLIFYFFLIRPQTKKIKEHTAMVEALKVGDKVITNGGIYGTVVKINGAEISLEVASGVNIAVDRMYIGGLAAPQNKNSAKPEAEPKKTVSAKAKKGKKKEL